jgi:predicted metal-dependent HD superfamily phosphohydrolase
MFVPADHAQPIAAGTQTHIAEHLMAGMNDIIRKASAHVTSLLQERLPPWAVYHTIDHTVQVVDACEEIAEASQLAKADHDAVMVAAWFHDVGYIDTVEGHEEKSAEYAAVFLQHNDVPPETIDQIIGCIRATKIPQEPRNVLEQIVCDADLVHLGKKKFFERSELMRLEWEIHGGKPIPEVEWLNTNIDFVTKNTFHTRYARDEFGGRRMKNLVELQDRLRAALSLTREGEERARMKKERLATKMEKEKRPERGIETMFRVVPKNHLDLSALADQKANIMISTNAIIISIVFGLLLSKLDTHPHLFIPTIILMTVCLTAMVFAILATRPNVTTGTFTKEDIEQKRANLLFFGNFHNSTLEDFTWGMKEMMNDSDYLYGSMITDLYHLGKVLGRKYRYLRICYNIFMYGLVVSVLAFVIALFTAPPPVQ